MPTALVVDRDVLMRNLARSVLTQRGYEVLDAVDAREASAICEFLDNTKIDLLIVESGTDPKSGKAVAERVMQCCPAVKILIISELTYTVIDHGQGLPAGFSFLQKPFTALQLLSAIQNTLEPRIH
ncbi:MAG: response regulator [Acidobacteriia bacterium]|nr:response regulator [Terriglobia bacterium]